MKIKGCKVIIRKKDNSKLSMRVYLLFVTLFLTVTYFPWATSADWWDDFTNGLHEKLIHGADFIRDKASPAIREKFDSAKETLQDPETHEQVQTWIKEKAVPVVEEKWTQFKSFVNEEVAPQLQKVYEAAIEASERQKQREKEQNSNNDRR